MCNVYVCVQVFVLYDKIVYVLCVYDVIVNSAHGIVSVRKHNKISLELFSNTMKNYINKFHSILIHQ